MLSVHSTGMHSGAQCLRACTDGACRARVGEFLKEGDVNITTLSEKPSRALDPFELRTESDRPPPAEGSLGDHRIPGAIDVGCVDWYLYPVNDTARPAER